jgi:cytoskeleton protein RodZ
MGMEKGSFGERLKREREMRGVSLEEISAATRISTRFLAALENDRWDELPGGIFNRGFIRAVARFLGLDEEALVAEYAVATNDRPAFAVTAKPPAKTLRAVWPAVVIATVAVLAVAAGLIYRHYRNPPVARTHTAAALAAAAALGPPAGTATASPAGPATVPAAPPMKLQVEVGRATRLTVTADGKTVFDGEVKPGESRAFEAHVEFRVSADDSSAVLLKLNGHTLPPLGPPEQTGSATFTREDLKKFEPGPL